MLWAGVLLLGLAGCASPGSDRSSVKHGELNDAPAITVTEPSSLPRPTGSGGSSGSSDATGTVPVVPSEALATIEPWTFGPYEGQILVTPNYRVHTTLTDDASLRRVPVFIEAALLNYRSALGELPPPPSKMSSFLFQTRAQWEAKMQQLLPNDAHSFHNLGRGGLTTDGQAILYYIDRRGMSDTLAITAHEGWHQYTQSTFKQSLPVWLEEGIATYMEGYVTRSDGVPSFRAWENRERRGALRESVRRDRMIPLGELFSRRPQAFLEDGRRTLLSYYAQVWALTHFLAVGEDGKYRASLEQVIQDAAHGNLHRRLMNSTAFTVRSRREMFSDRVGLWVILEYFNRDIAQFEEEFNAFLQVILESRALERLHNEEVFEGD